MKRRSILACLAVVLGSSVMAQTIDDVILPKKTVLFIKLQQSINSKTARTGDRFSARIDVPVTANDKVIVPVGSYILGYVDRAKKAGIIKGKAQLLLKFDSVILPSGVTRQIQAVVQSAEGYQTDPSSEEGSLKASGSQAGEVTSVATQGAVTGAITGATVGIFRGATLKGAGVGAAIGAAGGALISLLQRGKEVVLPPGATLTIQLQEGVRFVKPAPPPSGQPLKPDAGDPSGQTPVNQ